MLVAIQTLGKWLEGRLGGLWQVYQTEDVLSDQALLKTHGCVPYIEQGEGHSPGFLGY
jgi:hypothetical protein